MSVTGRKRGEFQTIQSLFAPLAAGSAGALGLTDDAAVLTPPMGQQAVVTVDAICSGVHYLPNDPPDLIARKLMRVNLSDLAAMGADPAGVFLTCAYGAECDDAWIEQFVKGLAEDVKEFDCPVLGGDTVKTLGPALFSLTALGWVPNQGALTRSAAKVGDLVAVTGTLGDGAMGLWAAKRLYEDGAKAFSAEDRACLVSLADRYHLPRPRLAAGRALRGFAHAAMDLSDGLLQDLGHICRASQVSIDIYAEALPYSQAFVKAPYPKSDRLELAVAGGDDYELCITLSEDAFQAASQAVGDVGLTVIGKCNAPDSAANAPTVRLLDGAGNGIDVGRRGWQHL